MNASAHVVFIPARVVHVDADRLLVQTVDDKLSLRPCQVSVIPCAQGKQLLISQLLAATAGALADNIMLE